MDGYTLQNKLRKARRRHHLSAPTQALYYELVAICNEEEWDDVFKCSNDELTAALNISEKSLLLYRQELITSGLIYYKSGQSKKKVGTYSFTTELNNGSKIYHQSDYQSGGESDYQSDYQSGEKGSDLIKTKTKRKTKQSKSHCGAGAPLAEKRENEGSIKNPQEKEEKKGPAQKKEEKGITPYWQKLVDTWFSFYRDRFDLEPTFNAASAKNLKTIIEGLQKISLQKNYQWTEDYAVRCLTHFLLKAYADGWLKANFLLSNLANKFDAIVNPMNDGHSKNGKAAAGVKVTGAGLDEALNRFYSKS